MARIETSVQIAAPAEVVFAFFVPQRMPYWYGADMHASFEVQDGASDFAVAQKVHITGNLGKREVSHTAVVTALQAGSPVRVAIQRPLRRQGPGALGAGAVRRGLAPASAENGGADAQRLHDARPRRQSDGLAVDAPCRRAAQSGLSRAPQTIRRARAGMNS